MTTPQGAPATATALQLLLTAERLFAENGLAGVSLRQIATEAGSSNNSAVAYHFGSKERLVEAIFGYRLPQLLQRRELLKARVHPGDLRGRLEAHLLPVLELAESHEGSYLSFLEQLERSSARLLLSPQAAQQSQADFVAEVQALLPDVEEPVRTMRIQQVQVLTLHAAAERERAVRNGEDVVAFGLFVSTLIDACTGYLTAPVSEETRRFLAYPDRGTLPPAVRLV
ncbi:MAG: TetR/AcrR family transcriptional regulator [Mycobacteriales bacterium]